MLWEIAVIAIIAIVSHTLVTEADIAPADRDNSIAPVIAKLTRRLDELEHKRAEDVQRAEELDQLRTRDLRKMSTRISELENLRASDVNALTAKLAKLEDIHAKELIVITASITELKELHYKDLLKLATFIEKLENIHSKDVKVISELTTKVNRLESAKTIVATTTDSGDDTADLTDPVINTSGTEHHDIEVTEVTEVNDTSAVVKNSLGIAKSDVPLPVLNTRARRVGSNIDSVAFHVYLDYNVYNPAAGYVVKFNRVITNVNAHYSPQTGVFTCTRAGVHVFSWAIQHSVPEYIFTELVRNGTVIGYSMVGDRDYPTSGSATAAADLAVGDKVWVRVSSHTDGVEIFGFRTMFTGFRIQ